MQTADIARSEAMGTNVMYAAALDAVSEMASILGKKKEAAEWQKKADDLAAAIDKRFWLEDKGYYGVYTYGRDNLIVNPREETLGESLAILFDVAPADRQKSISENVPHTPFGPAIFFPQISDIPNYHNNALWPFVASYWALAQAKAGNEQGTLEGIGSVFRPAALFATNKENFNLDNGDIFTELNSSNMLWSLSGNLALTNRILFGLHFEKDGLLIKPFVPQALADNRRLENFNYRGARLDISVNGYGSNVKSLTLNGKSLDPSKPIPAKMLKGDCRIVVDMDNQPIPEMKLNRTPNVKAPLTPVVRLVPNPVKMQTHIRKPQPELNLLEWNPIEYIAEYVVLKDGKEVGRTHTTSWPASEPGEWQVIGIASDGTPSFASEPLSNRLEFYSFPSKDKETMTSTEVSYQPKDGITGYHGGGFAELDRTSAPMDINVEIPEAGVYTVSFRYANGNGPVNTENKAAIRALLLDGKKVGTIVMPQRGVANWSDWGYTNSVAVEIPEGNHVLTLQYLPEDENMNISTNHALIDLVKVSKK